MSIRRGLRPRRPAGSASSTSTSCAHGAAPRSFQSAPEASRSRPHHPLASLYVRSRRTSSSCAARTRRSRAGGGSRCVPQSAARWNAVTPSAAPREPAGTCSNQAPNKLFEVLQVGDKAPDFQLPTTSGQELTLADGLQKFRALVLLFYVLDFTGG
ncbi:MAG: redoxin domain-containing protein [Chloroflexi bacterium]|nr:MAG: redoxin domain-containing protein [Chloroflexota bacterium]